MTIDKILAALPHRPPMLLVDEIVEQTADSILCLKNFQDQEYFFQGHYPDFPLVPGVILCECAVQAGAILLAERTSGTEGVPVLTRLNDVRFKRMVRPGETIQMTVKIEEVVSSAFYLSAKVTCDGQNVVRFNFACSLAPKKD